MTKNKTAIIFIPGLGDQNPWFQRAAVKLWQIYGYKSQLIQMNWQDQTAWSSKFGRLNKQIDKLISQGYKVCLIGASAGAPAAVNAYVLNQKNIPAVITIAAKINRPETIGSKYRQNNPSFIESINQAQQSLSLLKPADYKKIICIYSPRDGLVHKADSVISGAKVIKSRIPYHPLVIGYYLTFGFYKIHRSIKILTNVV